MNNTEFVEKLLDIQKNYKTYYATGTYGNKATAAFIDSKAKQYPKQYSASTVKKLKSLGEETRLFDCCGLIKSIFMGFPNVEYNGTYDLSDQGFYDKCKNKSTDFTKIEVGELLWLKGHVGVYIGNGLGIECTANWTSNVQITAVQNIGKKSGYNSRKWTAHGKIPFVDYTEVITEQIPESVPTSNFPYDVKVTVNSVLNIRSGAGTNYKVVGSLKNGEVVSITEEKNTVWGKLSNNKGWICLSYTKRITPTVQEPVVVTTSEEYYTVKIGDTITKIANKYKLPVDTIKRLNPQIKNFNLIYPGQKVRVK